MTARRVESRGSSEGREGKGTGEWENLCHSSYFLSSGASAHSSVSLLSTALFLTLSTSSEGMKFSTNSMLQLARVGEVKQHASYRVMCSTHLRLSCFCSSSAAMASSSRALVLSSWQSAISALVALRLERS